jgi:hypothetical protein
MGPVAGMFAHEASKATAAAAFKVVAMVRVLGCISGTPRLVFIKIH